MDYLFLELYKVGEQVYGQFIDSEHFARLKQEHGRTFKLPGQKVCQFFVVSNHAIRSEDAIDFIGRIEKGRVVYHHIDLSELTEPRKAKKK